MPLMTSGQSNLPLVAASPDLIRLSRRPNRFTMISCMVISCLACFHQSIDMYKYWLFIGRQILIYIFTVCIYICIDVSNSMRLGERKDIPHAMRHRPTDRGKNAQIQKQQTVHPSSGAPSSVRTHQSDLLSLLLSFAASACGLARR